MRIRILLVAAVTLLCSACLRATTVITVRQDGSGTIDQEVGITPLAAGFMRGFGEGGSEGGKKPQELFTEEQARHAGEEMGVRFLSGEPIKTAQLEGYRAKYAFDDIAKLTLKDKEKEKDAAATAAPAPGRSTMPPYGFEFIRGKDTATLVINMPPIDTSKLQPGLGRGTAQGRGAGAGPDAAQALAMMKMMMRGAFVDVTLAIDGKVRKANVPLADGRRLTLVQLDFDKLLADPAGLDKLQKAPDARALQNVPGITLPAEQKLTIEFGR